MRGTVDYLKNTMVIPTAGFWVLQTRTNSYLLQYFTDIYTTYKSICTHSAIGLVSYCFVYTVFVLIQFSSSSLLSSFMVWWFTSTFNMHISLYIYVNELEHINIKISDIRSFVRLRQRYTCPSIWKCNFISFRYCVSIYFLLNYALMTWQTQSRVTVRSSVSFY